MIPLVQIGALLGTGGALLLAASALAQTGVDCERCHGNREFLVGKGGSPDTEAALFVPRSQLDETSHRSLACAECHVGFDAAFPHRDGARTVSCRSCHEAIGGDWLASVHSENATTTGDAPDCVRCHGVHNVYPADDRRSPTHPLNEATLCGSCHGDPGIIATYFTDPADSVATMAVSRYHETVHGVALERSGLIISATCSDCHEAHRVLPSEAPESSVNPANVGETCGGCHLGVLETYRSSSHGRAHAAGWTSQGHEAPVCTTCHSSHGVVSVAEAWKADVVEECGHCHGHLYKTYFETYHGKTTRLGTELTAKCSDCHTPHGNLPASDPNSSVHPSNLVATCGKCHDETSARFVQYYAHGDHDDRERYPLLYWSYVLMSSLLVGVFGFFGTHTVLWLARGLSARRPAPATRAPEPQPEQGAEGP